MYKLERIIRLLRILDNKEPFVVIMAKDFDENKTITFLKINNEFLVGDVFEGILSESEFNTYTAKLL